jgi:hypothetical protein
MLPRPRGARFPCPTSGLRSTAQFVWAGALWVELALLTGAVVMWMAKLRIRLLRADLTEAEVTGALGSATTCRRATLSMSTAAALLFAQGAHRVHSGGATGRSGAGECRDGHQ